MRLFLFIFLGLFPVAHPAWAQDNSVTVAIFDGNPHDRVFIRNTGGCDFAYGVLTLDFAQSAGQVLIDTEYGGAGTQDPMPVEVEDGPLSIRPVQDGDRMLVVEIDGLAQGQTGTITLDVDNEAAGWRAARVSIIGDHVAGARAQFVTADQSASAVFDATGSAHIIMPAQACALQDVPLSAVPMG